MVMQPERLDTLDIRITRGPDLGYEVELRLGEREFPAGALGREIMASVAEAGADEAGARLFAAFCSDERVRMAWNLAAALAPRRRIRLRIDDDAPELHTLPWEALRDTSPAAADREPAADRDTPLLAPGPVVARPAARPQRAPRAGPQRRRGPPPTSTSTASPRSSAPTRSTASPTPWPSRPPASSSTPPSPAPCTLAALEAALERGFHVLHLVAHGVARRDGELSIFLEKDDGSVDRVDGSSFAAMLERLGRELRLVVLMVCSSAVRSPGDARVGLAPRLLAAGVPAVLAMQDLMPVATGRAFTRALYGELWSAGEVDRAANRARATLLTGALRGSAVPVLYSALAGNRLFTLAPAPAPPATIQADTIAQTAAIQTATIQTTTIQTTTLPPPLPTPPAGEWTALGGPFRQFTAIRGRDGVVELFAVGLHQDTLHARRQLPGAAWSEWEQSPDVAAVAATLDARGRVVQFARGPQGELWMRRRPTPATWTAWQNLGLDGDQLAVGCYAEDLVIAVTIASDALMYSNEETRPGGAWTDWAGDWEHDDETHLQIALARDRNALSIFSLHADHTLWQSREQGEDFSEWRKLGARIDRFAVAADLRGHLFLAAIADDRSLRTCTQKSPGGPWGPWERSEADLLDVHVTPLVDGVAIHAIDRDGAAGCFGADGWIALGGPALTSIVALETRKGELLRLGLDHAGTLHERREPVYP
jgi:hypothetical protein